MLVLVCAATTACVGLTVRDLTGDELAATASIPGILRHIYMPEGPESFSARLPLFPVLRAISMEIVGEGFLGRRLPAALATIAGAVALWGVLARRGRGRLGLVAGLVLALHPMASFHAHDSSNYALAALTTVCVLAGLVDLEEGPPSAAPLLATGLLLGTFSDFFFAFLGASALAVTVWLVRDGRDRARAAAISWGAVVVAQAVPAAVLLTHLARGPASAFVAPHADVDDAPDIGLLEAVGGHLRRVGTAFFEGHVPDGDGQLALLGVAALLTAVGVLQGWRCGRPVERMAVLLFALTFGQMLLVGLVFNALTGRVAPLHPRAHMGLLPLLAIVWGAAVTASRGRGLAAALLLLLLGTRTGGQLADIPDTHARVADRLAAEWASGDVLVTSREIAMRLPPEVRGRADLGLCVPSDRLGARRVWVTGDPGATWPGRVRVCAGEGEGVPLLDAAPFGLRLVESRPVPPYEWGSGSFLVGTVLYLFERGEAPSPIPGTVRLAAGATSRLGLRAVRTGHQRSDDDEPSTVEHRLGADVAVDGVPAGARRFLVDPVLAAPGGTASGGAIQLELAPSESGFRLVLGGFPGPVVWSSGLRPPRSTTGAHGAEAPDPVLTARAVHGEGPWARAVRRWSALLVAALALAGLRRREDP